MEKRARRLWGACGLLFAVTLPLRAQEPDRLQVWTGSGGDVRLELRADGLTGFGLEVAVDGRPARGSVETQRRLTPEDRLVIEAPHGNFARFLSGRVVLDTGWTLRYRGREVRLDGLILTPGIYRNNHPSLEARDKAGRHLLTFSHLHVLAEHERGTLIVHNADVEMTAELARLLGLEALASYPFAMAWLDLYLDVPDGADTSGRVGGACDGRPFWPQEGHPVDVGMIQIGQVSHQGTASDGRLKVTPSATLKNVGSVEDGDAAWISKFTSLGSYPYDPADQHPFLVWNMYRVTEERIEQLGASGVKHAFVTLNIGCTIECDGSGHVLYPGCEDVYGVGTNESGGSLGPRPEIEASVGLWENCGSFFDPNCVGNQTQSSGQFQNRLLVDPADLQTEGADYYLDSWYVVQYDIDIWNSMAYHELNPTPQGGGWTFGPLGPFTLGRVLDQWVNPEEPGPDAGHATVVVPSATPQAPYPDNVPQGHITVAVKVSEPEPGRYRYNYVVQNFDFERGVEAFRVPIGSGAQVFESFFGDIDDNAANDWEVSVDGGFVEFVAPPDNPLPWFTLFNFELETDTPPAAGQVTLDLGGDAVVPSINVGILGPDAGLLPALAFDPASLDFGEVEVGTTSEPQMAMLHNNGAAAATELAFNGLPAAGFAADTSACGSTLDPGESCHVNVTFTPAEPGVATAALSVGSLEGAGTSLAVAGEGVGGGGETHVVTVTDNAFEPAELTIEVGDTVEWNNVQGSHNVVADDGSFTSGPVAPAPWTFSFTFDGAGTNPYFCAAHGGPGGVGMSGVITVVGEAAPELSFDPASLDYGAVVVGTSGPDQVTTLTNTGTAPATGLELSGLPDGGFTADTSACGATLDPEESCEVTISFAPSEIGPADATLEATSAEGAAASAAMAGHGLAEGAHLVVVRNFEFDPPELTIRVGETVQWDNVQGFHNVIADDESFNSGAPAPAPWTFSNTFDSTGSFPYYCAPHGGPGGQGMAAVIHVVAEAATPMALEVDPQAGSISDGNGILEPAELVTVAPAWRNDEDTAVSPTGAASQFDGPEGGNYSLVDADADYGPVDPDATASCLDTGDCYQMGLNDPAPRPAAHWDATFEEVLSGGAAQTWTLHVGDSFTDVPRTSPFYPSIERLLHHGVTGGCTGTTYCPGATVSRDQMSVFLLKALEGGSYAPPACSGVFGDVPCPSLFANWIEDLVARGVTAGCGGGNYCPSNPVSRDQMSVFLLKTLEGPSYTPPACTGVFGDVPCPSLFAAWIEDLVARGITAGCGSGNYCPGNPVSRDQMAVFLAKTFGLTLYGP